MHVTTKETDQNGVHILNSVIEGDGPVQLASEQAELEAKVISVSRTASGGLAVQVAVSVTEPAAIVPEAPKPEPSAAEQAASYLESKGLSPEEAQAAVDKFGADKVLGQKQDELDSELKALVAK